MAISMIQQSPLLKLLNQLTENPVSCVLATLPLDEIILFEGTISVLDQQLQEFTFVAFMFLWIFSAVLSFKLCDASNEYSVCSLYFTHIRVCGKLRTSIWYSTGFVREA